MFRTWRSRTPPEAAFDDELGDAFGTAVHPQSFDPDYDVRTDESAIRFWLDVPGVRESALAVEVHEGTLTIAGTRAFEAGEDGEQVLLGRRYGRFSRAFKLPTDADTTRLQAELQDGVLKIIIPRQGGPRDKTPSLAGSDPKRLGGGGSR